MITTSKVLGTAKPASTTVTTLYTVPDNTQASGTVAICNQSATPDPVRVAFVPSGDTLDLKNYVLYDTNVPANGVIEKTFDLNTGGTIQVYTQNGTCSFVAHGMEVA